MNQHYFCCILCFYWELFLCEYYTFNIRIEYRTKFRYRLVSNKTCYRTSTTRNHINYYLTEKPFKPTTTKLHRLCLDSSTNLAALLQLLEWLLGNTTITTCNFQQSVRWVKSECFVNRSVTPTYSHSSPNKPHRITEGKVSSYTMYSTVFYPQDCSMFFTLYSLADLFNRTPSQLVWEASSHTAINAHIAERTRAMQIEKTRRFDTAAQDYFSWPKGLATVPRRQGMTIVF